MSQDDDWQRVYPLFFAPGEVVEIRALGLRGSNPAWEGWVGGSGTVCGYFDNAADFGRAAASLAPLSGAVYFTPNPCQPALLARAANRLVAEEKKRPTTSDHTIAAIRWLLIDLDPKRPAGISSSNDELAAAKEVARELTQYLEAELGWPLGIRALSGNGYHLCYRLPDLVNGPEVSGRDGLVHRALQALAARCNTEQVQVDLVVYNAARIWKLYGTWARKGDHTDDRPHRRSGLFANVPMALAELGVVSREQLAALAALAPAPAALLPPAPPLSQPGVPGQTSRLDNSLGEMDMGRYLAHYGIAHRVEERQGSQWYLLDACVFDSAHRGGEAAIVVAPGRPFTYTCFHNSCQGRKWHEARAMISGTDKIAQFYSKYDPQAAARRPSPGAGAAMAGGTVQAVLAGLDVSTFLIGDQAVTLPGPREVDPMEFFVFRGKRESFNLRLLAAYLVAKLDPIVYTQREFWRYVDGVWRQWEAHDVQKHAAYALGYRVQASWPGNAADLVGQLRHQREADWVVDEDLINLKNGMLDIAARPFALHPHDPGLWSRSQLPVTYDPDATAPIWERTVAEIMDGVEPKIMQLQEFFGYCLLPTCRFEKAMFLFGTGANGKSTVISVLERLLIGQENTAALNLEGLNRRFTTPTLRGKMINISTELETGRGGASTEVLKKAISGDLLEGEIKNGENITFRSFAKFIFAMNTPPTITDKAYGFVRKVLVLNFTRRFADGSQDPDLFDKLMAEASGILNWALAGAARLIEQKGFTVAPENIKEAETFMASLNPVLQFFEESVRAEPTASVEMQVLYEQYTAWCESAGLGAVGRPRFVDQVQQRFPTVVYRKSGRRDARRGMTFYGLGLVSAMEMEG